MAKTLFSSGVIVTSAWLNGARDIVFDGQDLDWHYNPLGLDSLDTSSPNGLDTRYITLSTDQPSLSETGVFLTGQPLSGSKTVSGRWNFGFDPAVNPSVNQNFNNAPHSYLTNLKYNNASGIPTPSVPQRFAALSNSDLITKEILVGQLNTLVIDNGEF